MVSREGSDFAVTTECSSEGILVRVEIFREVPTRAALDQFFYGVKMLMDDIKVGEDAVVEAFAKAFRMNAVHVDSVEQARALCPCAACRARRSGGAQA